ncbi:hypothetical protein F5Y11DRAFT_350881 [Daldinia sp. FL1419]|nr:hypothetical protein F5Y11DRAFT_350881 [Daldinia sp. FL1419]
MDFLAQRMNKLALLALEDANNIIETLQGIILLCHWPVPTSSMYKDMTQMLSGAALHLAMQIGLHIVGTGQDFARTVLSSNTNHSSKAFRAQLWSYCLITYHSTSLRQGILPLVLLDSPQTKPPDAGLFPDDLEASRRMHGILIAATTSVVRLISPIGSNSQSELKPFICLYDTQLEEVAADIKSALSMVYLYCYRIHLLAYHFLDCCGPDHEGLIKLYIVSCKLIESLTSQDESTGFARACPEFIHRTTLLSAISILKIHKSVLVRHVNSTRGEKAYFSAIYQCQRASLQNDDLCARGVTILGQMWTSKNMYRQPDGRIDSLSTRIRSRLSMSVVFDSFWWWRVEFNGQTSPYPEQNQIAPAPQDNSQNSNSPRQPGASSTGQVMDFPVYCNIDMMPFNEPFPDYEWAVNFDFPAPN